MNGRAETPRAPRPGVDADSDFVFLYHAQYQKAHQLAWLLTHSTQDTEEIVQEAFLSLFRRFELVNDPVAYLRKSIVNSSRSLYRRRGRGALRQHPPSVDHLDDVGHLDLADILSDLPYRQRVVIVGRYWADLSEADIADLLGCPRGTVKSLASRALDRIRHQIGDDSAL